jgi:hypothetical protein
VTGEAHHLYDPTGSALEKDLTVDGTRHRLEIMDVNSTMFHGPNDQGFNVGIFDMFLARATGVVLLYDITDLQSYVNITTRGYLHFYLSRKLVSVQPGLMEDGLRYPCERRRFGCVLVGMKKDLADAHGREVESEVAREWAESQGIGFWEVDKSDLEGIEEATRGLVVDIEKKERKDEEDAVAVREYMDKVRTKLKEKSRVAAKKEGSKGVFSLIGGALGQVLPRSKSRSKSKSNS